MCIFRSRNPKCPGYPSILNESRRYPLFSALLRSKFGSLNFALFESLLLVVWNSSAIRLQVFKMTLSRKFRLWPDSFKTVCTVSRLSGSFQDCQDSFHAIGMVARLSGGSGKFGLTEIFLVAMLPGYQPLPAPGLALSGQSRTNGQGTNIQQPHFSNCPNIHK